MDQDKIRFQIEQTPSQELTKEGSTVIMWHSWRTWLNVAAVLMLLVVVGCLVYNAAVWASRGYDSVWKDYFPRILFYLVFGIFFLVRLLILPESRSRKYISKLSAVYGDPVALTITYSFGDDSYQTKTSDGATINTAYDQILSVYETTHGIIMERKMHLFESLDKSRIQGGTFPEFRTFLQEKMPNAEFHWKRNAN